MIKAVFVDGINKGEVFKRKGRWYWQRNGVDPMPPGATLKDLAEWARKCCNGTSAEVRTVMVLPPPPPAPASPSSALSVEDGEALEPWHQFESASAAASEYREFWEAHQGDFDQFGNYIPYSQMDGDLRAARARIAELEAKLAPTSPAPDPSSPNREEIVDAKD